MICDGMAFVSANDQHHQIMLNQPLHHHHHDHEEDYINHHPPPSTSPLPLPPRSPQDFHAAAVVGGQMRRSMSFSGVGNNKCGDQEMMIMMMNGGDDDMSDDGSPLGEKKKRLSMEQVRALEKSFELGNKLEPERKTQLARALGLQPRQVAIWFQNRRARWKTKQLERDYEVLKRKFEALKGENDGLQAHNKKLHEELLALKGRESSGYGPINLNKETENSWSNGNSEENSCDINLGTTTTPLTDSPLYSHQLSNKNIFHSSIGTTTSLTHLLQTSSRSDAQQFRKIDPSVPDESFCNMFTAIEDHPGFWPWPEQQHFH